MEKFVIIPDSSSDCTIDLRERFDIPDYVSGYVIFPNGESKKVTMDWEDISPDEFYESLKNKKNVYKTSAPNIEDFKQIWEKFLQEGNDIISISLSSALSATYNFSLQAAKELMEKYPERKIYCVDSLRYSTALAYLIMLAGKLKQEGKTAKEVYEWLEINKHCIHQMGPMDDLFYLARSGRISTTKAFMGSLIGVNPLADFNHKGLAEVLGKAKGSKKALQVCIEYIRQTIVDPENQIIFIAQSARTEKAEVFKQMIENEFHPREIIITSVGLSCGPNVGPGLVAAYYFGKPISSDSLKEHELMEKILAK